MSKAFTSEETDVAEVVAPRAPLPPNTPNYVTPRGLAMLHEERASLVEKRAALREGEATAITARIAELDERIAIAQLVDSKTASDVVRFGTLVTIRSEDHERRFRIVGVDEANPAEETVAFTSPIARALLGHEVGDEIQFRTPRGVETLEIVSIG